MTILSASASLNSQDEDVILSQGLFHALYPKQIYAIYSFFHSPHRLIPPNEAALRTFKATLKGIYQGMWHTILVAGPSQSLTSVAVNPKPADPTSQSARLSVLGTTKRGLSIPDLSLDFSIAAHRISCSSTLLLLKVES